jgi:hypothetical protein
VRFFPGFCWFNDVAKVFTVLSEKENFSILFARFPKSDFRIEIGDSEVESSCVKGLRTNFSSLRAERSTSLFPAPTSHFQYHKQATSSDKTFPVNQASRDAKTSEGAQKVERN